MTTMQNAGLHRFAAFTAACTFLLLVAGALVTSNDAGLSVPDWPLAYGALVPPLAGNIVYEYGHRVIAGFVGILTIVLAVWLWHREPRRWVRQLGLAAVGVVIAQAILGGLTVRFLQPVVVSVAHATLAQIFFSTVISLALFTSRWWQGDPTRIEDSGSPRIHTLAMGTVAAVFLQLIVGAAFRHKGLGLVPHLVGAAVVTLLVFWTAGALRRRFAGIPALARCRRLLHTLIGVQLLLGTAAWWSRGFAREFPQPIPVMAWLTVAHTVVGALVLAAAVLTALLSFRVLSPRRDEVPAPCTPKINEQAAQ